MPYHSAHPLSWLATKWPALIKDVSGKEESSLFVIVISSQKSEVSNHSGGQS